MTTKLLIGLAVLNLAITHPLLTAVILVAVFFYDHLTAAERAEIIKTMTSIYRNGKQFTKYLTTKAQELGVKLPELRKNIVVDLEIPETKADNVSIDFSDLTDEEVQIVNNSPALKEKILRIVKEALVVPETVWVEASLAEMYASTNTANPEDKFNRWGINNLDFNKIFTEKDYRSLKSKLKAVGKSATGEIENSTKHLAAISTLNSIKSFFTNTSIDPVNLTDENYV